MEKISDRANFFDIIPALICCINTDYSFKYLDPEWERLLGYPMKDLLSRSFFDFIHPDDLEKTKSTLEEQLKAELPVNLVNRYICEDGSYKELEWKIIFSGGDTIFAVARHVTENIRSEDMLRDSEDRYRGLFNCITDAILVENADRTIIDCNDGFMQLFGYTLNELKGKPTHIIYSNDEEYNNIGGFLKRDIESHVSFNKINFRKKNGDIFPGELKVFYFKNREGEITGSIGIIKDHTNIIKTKDALKEAEYKYHSLFDYMLDACALHEIICDENGKPIQK